VEELRQRLVEKNRHIEKKTVTATQATQDRNRLNNELNELRDHMDIKDRKINVLQRKVGPLFIYMTVLSLSLLSFAASKQCFDSSSKHYYEF
jgi:chromosome segregation ATPase